MTYADGLGTPSRFVTSATRLPARPPGAHLQVRRTGLVLLIWSVLGTFSPSAPQAQVGASDTARAPSEEAGVQPGDLIRLKVWREPDMSGDIIVDAAGDATLPRLGPVHVAGLAADSLRRFLVSSYGKYLKDPAIEVTVQPRITILGAVRQPGVHNVDPTLTIADALALAGGASPDGKQDNIELRRRGTRVPVKLSLGARLADTPVRSGDQLVVPQRSWLGRNTGVVLGAVSVGTSLLYLIFR
jgi:protein involved in polysaccharide export with SLBB domain